MLRRPKHSKIEVVAPEEKEIGFYYKETQGLASMGGPLVGKSEEEILP